MIITELLIMIIIVTVLMHIINIKLKLLIKLYFLDLPSPKKCYPLIGHALLIFGQNEEERLKTLTKLFLSYPRLAKFWYGPVPIIGISHPDLVKTVLMANECLEKSNYFYKMYDLSNSLIAAKSEKWKVDRKILNHSFNLKVLEGFITTFCDCADDINQQLEKHVNGGTFDVLHYISLCTLDMLMKTSYRLKMSVFENEDTQRNYNQLIKAVEVIYQGMSTRFNNPLLHPHVLYKHTETYQKEQTGRQIAKNYQEKLYQQRKDILMQSDGNAGKFNTFIDHMIFNEEKFDHKTIVDNLILLLLAGFETTSNETAHVLLMLAIYSDVQEKVYQEICDVFHSENVDVKIENLNKLHYMDQVIKETMRLFPIAPHISRTVIDNDLMLDAHKIPVGTIIFLNLFALHRREDFWGPDATKFNPDNFSPEKARIRHPFSFIPFSAGKRNCLGQRYATNSMKVLLVKILKKFRVSTDIKFEDLRFKSDVTLKLCIPHNIQLMKR